MRTLETTLADIDVDITININGCPNACARTQVADIGLKGQLVAGPDGAHGRGLPGAPRRRPRPVRRQTGPASAASCAVSRPPRSELPEYVSRLARRYAAERAEGESFAPWVVRADEEALR